MCWFILNGCKNWVKTSGNNGEMGEAIVAYTQNDLYHFNRRQNIYN